MAGEFELIAKLRQQLSDSGLLVGVGDDAAVIARDDGSSWLIATDMLMDGVHFDVANTNPRLIGRKALGVNLSDIAAMGAVPTTAVVSVALPRGSSIGEELHTGLFQLAGEFDTVIAGGDTNSWDGPLVINVAVTGELPPGAKPFERRGARVGDWIFVTGPLGGSLDGHHFSFTPRVREAQILRSITTVNSMIDISDGLAADLHHILDESEVGAVLFAERIPIRESIQTQPGALKRALGDGEDFELLFTVSAGEAQRLIANAPDAVELFHIGEITESGAELVLPDASREPLLRRGWEHAL